MDKDLKSSIFVSHSGGDLQAVVAIVAELRKSGARVWFDRDEIRLGDSILARMSEGLTKCDHLLVAWSSAAESSSHVWNEIEAFYIRSPRAGAILFVLLDQTPVPTLYAARKYLTSTGDYASDARAICSWIQGQSSSEILDPPPELPPARTLVMYPRGPMVQTHMITDGLISAYAEMLNTDFKAASVINKAVRLRLEADPGDPNVTTLKLHHLPSLSHTSAFEFWQTAFYEACKHGPRMLAALLFAQDDDLFDETVRKDRAKLLQHLRSP